MIELIPTKRLRHTVRKNVKYAKRPRRYRQLLAEAERIQPSSFLEIGVFTGVRGVEVIEAASLGKPAGAIAYHGFDLFEHMNEEILKSELSKVPAPMHEVHDRLASTGADVHLHKGWTQQSLQEFQSANPDFRTELAFIDGGHAIDTIQSDWNYVSEMLSDDGVVIFDDYYVDCPHLIEEFGCNKVLETLNSDDWTVTLLPEVDRFVNDGVPLNVSFAKVTRAKAS